MPIIACQDLSDLVFTRKRLSEQVEHGRIQQSQRVADRTQTSLSLRLDELMKLHDDGRKASLREKFEATQEILKLIPSYNALRPEKTEIYLKMLVKNHIRWLRWQSRPLDLEFVPLQLLRCMRELKPMLFEKYCKKIKECCDLSDAVKLAFKYPQEMQALEGTSFSTQSLIEKSFSNAQRDNAKDGFEKFLSYGQAWHHVYEQRIIGMLSVDLRESNGCKEETLKLIQSPLRSLRIAAFHSLAEYCTKLPADWFREHWFNELLKVDLSTIYSDNCAVQSYQYIYRACKRNDNMKAVQTLLVGLSANNDKDVRAFLIEILQELFNLEKIFFSPEATFEQLLTTALQTALKESTKSIDYIIDFLNDARCTGLDCFINKEFFEATSSYFLEYKFKLLSQETSPLAERVRIFNDLFIGQTVPQTNGIVAPVVKNLASSLFKDYCTTVLNALSDGQAWYDYCCNRKKLRILHEADSVFDAEPCVIQQACPEYLNAFEMFHDKPIIHAQLINRELDQVCLKNNLLYGFAQVRNTSEWKDGLPTYRLCACDATDGYMVWANLTGNKLNSFVVSDEAVYCINDSREIVILDALNGRINGLIPIPLSGEIRALHITPSKKLCIVVKRMLVMADVSQLSESRPINWIYCQLPVGKKVSDCSFVDDHVFAVADFKEREKQILMHDYNGQKQTFVCNCSILFHGSTQANDHLIWYVKKEENRVVFLDKMCGNKVYEFETSGTVICPPVASCRRDKLYILTHDELIALDISRMPSQPPSIIWKTSLSKIKNLLRSYQSTELIIAQDDSALYMIDHANQVLFKIDCGTGEIHQLDNLKYGRATRLLGVCNNKAYVQPYSY